MTQTTLRLTTQPQFCEPWRRNPRSRTFAGAGFIRRKEGNDLQICTTPYKNAYNDDVRLSMFLHPRCHNEIPHTATRFLIVLWLPLWISLPFIHIHPGIGHAHASPDHDHTPIFHSIFQTDLPDVQGTHHLHSLHGDEIVLSSLHPEWEHTHQELVHPELKFSTLPPSSNCVTGIENQPLARETPLFAAFLFPTKCCLHWHTVIPPPEYPSFLPSPRGPPPF